MKVLFITNVPTPYRTLFFEELSKMVSLTVFYENEKVDYRKWDNNNSKQYESKFFDFNKNTMIKNIHRLIKELRKEKYDIYMIGGYATPIGIVTILYLKLVGKKFILNADGGIINTKENLCKKLLKKIFISSANYWTSSGKITDEYLIYYGANRDKIRRYNFTSLTSKDIKLSKLSLSEKIKLKKELGIKEEKICVSVGQFIFRKGFDVLIQATSLISEDYGVYIIGGQPSDEYIKLKEKYNLSNAYFLDFKEKKELLKYYEVADIFVLPTREDIWGLVINEAMATGLPIITTDKCVAGLELVTDGVNGYIIPSDNYLLLGEKINYILKNDHLRNQMIKESINSISNYTIENMAEAHIKLFEEFIEDIGLNNRFHF